MPIPADRRALDGHGLGLGRVREHLLAAADTFCMAIPVLECVGGTYAFLWGFWLLAFPANFTRYSAYFRPLALLAPAPAWGLAAMALGAFQWCATARGWYAGRRVATFLAFLGWTGIAVSFALEDMGAYGIPQAIVHGVTALGCFLALGNLYRYGRRPTDGSGAE